jgi:hypothetical protein
MFRPPETQPFALLREATSPWTSEKLLLGLMVMEAGVVSGGVEDL